MCCRFQMSRNWIRLIACLSMAAYLLANTHAAFALRAQLRSSFLASAAKDSSSEKQNGSKTQSRAKCKCCGQPVNAHSATCQEAQCQDDTCPEPANNGDDCTCPCCPGKKPFDSSCPCPDGCALCCVAKVPLPAVCISVGLMAAQVETIDFDVCPFPFSSVIGKLFRPPRF